MYSPASYPLGVEPESVVHEAAQRRARVWAMSMADRRMCERPAILSPISGQRLCHLDDMDTREAITLDGRAQQRLDVLNHVLAGEPQPARADEPDRAAGAGRRQPPRLARSGPWLTLVGAIDNATGIVSGAVFREQEDAVGYFQALGQIARAYGLPVSGCTPIGTPSGSRWPTMRSMSLAVDSDSGSVSSAQVQPGGPRPRRP